MQYNLSLHFVCEAIQSLGVIGTWNLIQNIDFLRKPTKIYKKGIGTLLLQNLYYFIYQAGESTSK